MDGDNWYTYCYNNPLRYKDPTGKVAIVDDAVILVVAGAIMLVSYAVSEYGANVEVYDPPHIRTEPEVINAEDVSTRGRTETYDPPTINDHTESYPDLNIGPQTESYPDDSAPIDDGVMDSRPESLTPTGATRRHAFREAKRVNGIPMSQQPTKVLPNVDKRDRVQPGRRYFFDIPGTTDDVIIRDDAGGHEFADDATQNRGPHFNDPQDNHFDYY